MRTDYTILTDDELKVMAKDECKKQIRLAANAEACQQTVADLHRELVRRALGRKGIKVGDRVAVNYSDSTKYFQCEGIANGCSKPGQPLVLRAVTTQGKLAKRTRHYDVDLITYMTKTEN
jgi:hypothetical protein